MNVEHNRGFNRDPSRVRSFELRQRVLRKIDELEAASVIREVRGLQKWRARKPTTVSG